MIVSFNTLSVWRGDTGKHAFLFFWLEQQRSAKDLRIGVSAIHTIHPWIGHMSPYRDPLWACVTIDPAGELRIEGVHSQWVAPSPKELGYKGGSNEQGIVPRISAQNIKVSEKRT